jgi:hypothetical protein
MEREPSFDSDLSLFETIQKIQASKDGKGVYFFEILSYYAAIYREMTFPQI